MTRRGGRKKKKTNAQDRKDFGVPAPVNLKTVKRYSGTIIRITHNEVAQIGEGWKEKKKRGGRKKEKSAETEKGKVLTSFMDGYRDACSLWVRNT